MPLPKIAFVAPLIRAGLATLQASMPEQVALFNAEGNAQIVTPATMHFGGTDLLSAFEFPQLELAGVAGDSGPFSIDRTEFDHDPRLTCGIWVQGAKGEIPELYEQVLGLVRCAIECLAPRNAFGPGVELSQAGGISYRIDVVPQDLTAAQPSAGRDFQNWLGSGMISFHLETVERLS